MTDHTGSSYKGYIGIDQKSGDIAHYGKNFANGDRGGHWDIQIEQVLPGLPGFVVSLKQSTQKGTRWRPIIISLLSETIPFLLSFAAPVLGCLLS